MRIIFFLLFLTPFCSNPFVFSQDKPQLYLSRIMEGENFVGYLPENIQWSEDGKSIYFTWNPEKELIRSLYKINVKGLEPVKVSPEEMKGVPPTEGDYSRDFNQKVYSKNGDIFLFNVKSGEILQITNTLKNEINPVFTADEKKIIYRTGKNLYISFRNR